MPTQLLTLDLALFTTSNHPATSTRNEAFFLIVKGDEKQPLFTPYFCHIVHYCTHGQSGVVFSSLYSVSQTSKGAKPTGLAPFGSILRPEMTQVAYWKATCVMNSPKGAIGTLRRRVPRQLRKLPSPKDLASKAVFFGLDVQVSLDPVYRPLRHCVFGSNPVHVLGSDFTLGKNCKQQLLGLIPF